MTILASQTTSVLHSCLQRVMVGCIILYDHVHLVGAFSKKNPAIDVSCIYYTCFALKAETQVG